LWISRHEKHSVDQTGRAQPLPKLGSGHLGHNDVGEQEINLSFPCCRQSSCV
jgi:hypothetical protein